MKNLGILAVLELISLILLMGVLIQQHQLPLFRQLHHALNVYSPIILSLMCTWSVLATVGRVVHWGNDYTFQFDEW